MNNFDEMINVILKKEGGFSDHPDDRGGPTNFGITLKTLEDWTGRSCTTEDIKNLRKDQAIKIYSIRFFTEPKIHYLPKEIQLLMFDCSVNHGPSLAIRFLQDVINITGLCPPIRVDGKNGPITQESAKVCQKLMGNYFNNSIVDERKYFYNKIVENDESQRVFLKGWINKRIQPFYKEV